MSFRLPTSSLQRRTDGSPPGDPLRFRQWTSKFGSQVFPRRRRLGPVLAGWIIAGTGHLFGQVTNLPPSHLDLPSAELSLLRVVGALALVVALFLLGIWSYRHWQRLTLYRGRAPKLSILEVRPLGNRTALYVVSYERERLLLASSPSGTHLLTRLPAQEEVAVMSQPDFANTLEEVLKPASLGLG